MKLCECGSCGQEVRKEGNKYIKGHNMRGKKNPGHSKWMKSGGASYMNSFQTEESARRMSEKRKGRTKENNEGVRRQAEKHSKWMMSGGATFLNSFPRDPRKLEKERDRKRKYMLNGGAAYASKFIKNPSNEETKLRGIVKELYPTSEHTYKVLENRGYVVDNALIEYKIAIEFDGWYHFDTEEHKKYHKRRQEEIEEEGWKFLRYDIFHPLPSKEQVRNDTQKLMES